jgi:hypothetical protein
MSDNFHHIDKLFKDAARQAPSAEYRQEYWNDMATLLKNDRSHKRRLLFISTAGFMVVLGILTVLFATSSVQERYISHARDLEIHVLDLLSNESIHTANQLAELSNVATPLLSVNTLILSNTATKDPVESITSIKTNIAIDNVDTIPLLNLPIQTLSELPEYQQTSFSLPENSITAYTLNNKLQSSTEVFAGFGMGQTHHGNGLSHNFSVGMKLNYQLNKLKFTTGVGIQHESNPGVHFEERSQVYSFGVTDFEHHLIYRSFTDLTIPLEFGYQHKSHGFGFGVQGRMLLTTRMSFESKENGMMTAEELLNGRTEGLRNLDADVYTYYNRALTDKCSLHLRLGTQTAGRIADNTYFSPTSTNKILSGQVQLSYRLGH